jgi:hypothetical protein
MSSKLLKGSFVIIVIAGLLFICTQAVTQFKQTNNKKEVETENTWDAAEFGKPTGEDPLVEIEKLSKWYKPGKQVIFTGFIRLFNDNEAAPRLMEEKKFVFSVDSNRNASYEVGGVEVINNKNYSLTVDNNNKFVFLTKNPKATPQSQAGFFDIAAFEKVLKETNAEAEVTQSGEEKILVVKNIKDPSVQGYAIYYSPRNYHINKIVLQMWQLAPLQEINGSSSVDNDSSNDDSNETDKNNAEAEIDGYYYKLEISYSGIDTLKRNNRAPENKFIKIINNQVRLTPEYSEYELINQLN